MTLESIKLISIREYLASMGILPVNTGERRGVFRSPFREEAHPSFSVDYGRNLWYDHGLGRGGSIIDLVMRVENCDVGEAIRHLDQTDLPSVSPGAVRMADPSIRIQYDVAVSHPSLIEYALSRCIRPSVLAKYCREVRYTMYGNRRFAIGFRNDAGGWELRTSKCKMTSAPKDVSTVIGEDSGVALVFEGFFDFLTYASMHDDGAPLPYNAMVLNSLAMLRRGSVLGGYRELRLYLDNDDAGCDAARTIRERYPGASVTDCSGTYEGYKDLNEHHIAMTMERLARE